MLNAAFYYQNFLLRERYMLSSVLKYARMERTENAITSIAKMSQDAAKYLRVNTTKGLSTITIAPRMATGLKQERSFFSPPI